MSVIQWLYHYKIIMKKKREEKLEKKEFTQNLASSLVEVLDKIAFSNTEFLASFIDPRKFTRYLEMKEEREKNKESEGEAFEPKTSEDQKFLNDFEDIFGGESLFPDELNVAVGEDAAGDRGIKKIAKKMLGIQRR